MSIANYKPDAPTLQQPTIPVIAAPEAKSVAVDTAYSPLKSLTAHIGGARWATTYYKQVMTETSKPKGLDTGMSAVNQQYIKINGLELLVENPLSNFEDHQLKLTKITGTSHIYAGVVPDEGDHFTADVGDGRLGLFRINSTEKKSILRDTAFTVEYVMVSFVDEDPLRVKNLEMKVIKNTFFHRDFINYGQNPILVTDDHEAILDLEHKFKDIALNYFRMFFNRAIGVLVLPSQKNLVFDYFVSSVMFSILDTHHAPEIIEAKRLSTAGDLYLNQPTIWTALLRCDYGTLEVANKRMGLTSLATFQRMPQLGGLRYSGVNSIVYPIEPELKNIGAVEFEDTSGYYLYDWLYGQEIIGGRLITGASKPKPVTDLYGGVPTADNVINDTVGDVVVKPAELDTLRFKKLTESAFYVFSEDFYHNNRDNLSTLERLTLDYLQNKPTPPTELSRLIANYQRWGGLEKFYHLPVVLILIKSIIRST